MRTCQQQISSRPVWTLIATIVGLMLVCASAAFADDIVPGHVLVRVLPGTDINALAASFGSTVQDQVLGIDIYSLATPNGTTEDAFAAQIGADLRVVYAEVDRFLASPEVEGEPFHLPFDRSPKPQTYAASATYLQINVGKTISLFRSGQGRPLATGHGMIVAVLDTGVDFMHPDLRRNLMPGFNMLAPGQLPSDIADGTTNAEFGHGTMIAGIIVRLAPLVRILPVRVINGDGKGTLLDLAKGIGYAISQHANVINISLSCSVTSSVLRETLDASEASGMLIVSAAGNLNTSQVNPPAAHNGSVAVAAVEEDNRKSPYSNYGNFVRVVAPGSNIRSTYPGGQYATWSGTSFAAPFVAAQAALMLSARPTLTALAVHSLIRDTAHSVDGVNPDYKGRLGKGIIDIDAAIRAARR